jgi:hypothetical protein
MSRTARGDRPIAVRLSVGDRELLADLVSEYLTLIEASAGDRSNDITDPAMARLFPSAYRDDEEAADEFRRFTRNELAEGKLADARSVVTALGADGSLRLARTEVHGWLRLLTSLRLVLAERLGIHRDGDEGDSRPEAAATREIYAWLGYLQEYLIHQLDS